MQRRVIQTIQTLELARRAVPVGILTLLMSLEVGCGDPCLDDGLPTNQCKNAASGSETATTAESAESGTAEGNSAEAGTAEGTGDGDGDPGDGDGDPGDGDGDPGDGDGDDPCQNGMQDPNDTGIDCGGDCVFINPQNPNDIEGQCGEGDLCEIDTDCTAGFCDEGMCNVCPGDPPEFDPIDLGYNECQSCLLSNCCEDVLMCFDEIEKCVCWFNCVSSTGDTQQCMDECGNGNIGTINSCMNSQCGADGMSLNCDIAP
jgi:hypothetical protein